jgi:hypothetical protein
VRAKNAVFVFFGGEAHLEASRAVSFVDEDRQGFSTTAAKGGTDDELARVLFVNEWGCRREDERLGSAAHHEQVVARARRRARPGVVRIEHPRAVDLQLVCVHPNRELYVRAHLAHTVLTDRDRGEWNSSEPIAELAKELDVRGLRADRKPEAKRKRGT